MNVRMIGTGIALSQKISGLFWVTESEIIAVPFTEETRAMFSNALSISENTFTHLKLWNAVKPRKCNKPYDYYPRGRVATFPANETIIYANPNISEENIAVIATVFCVGKGYTVRRDYSEQYQCFQDKKT